MEGNQRAFDYIDTLDHFLLPFAAATHLDVYIFMQDNAAIHTVHVTRHWLVDSGIDLLPWLARSPDLNLYEKLWDVLLERVYRDSRQFSTNSELKQAVEIEWDSLEPALFVKLVNSMPTMHFLVIKEKVTHADFN